MKALKQFFFIDKGCDDEPASTQKGDVEVLPQTQKARHQLLPEPTPTPLQAERLSELQATMTLKAERLLEERARAKEEEEEREHVQVGIGGTLGPDSSFPQGRYVVRQLLGKGVYGKVFECEDLAQEGRLVAVKVSRDHEWVRDAALKEIQLLRKLKGACGVLCYYNNFSHLRHVCIAVELCGENLKTKLGRVGALTLEQVADVGLQILHGIQYMHAWGYVHADLKPENVLVHHRGLENDVVERPLIIRIADLGSALFNEDSFRPERGTKEYCAPEVVLKTGWSYEVDLWAIGCVLAELFTGKKLFCAELDCNVHLMMMQKRLGRTFPQTLLRKAWQQGNQLVQGHYNGHDGLRINPMITDVLQEKKLREGSYVLSEVVSNPLLLDLLGQLLQFEPNERSKAAPLRAHALFKCARIQDLKKTVAKNEEARLKSDSEEKAVEQAAAAARAARVRKEEVEVVVVVDRQDEATSLTAEAVQSAEKAAAAKEAASLQCLTALLRKSADEAKMAQALEIKSAGASEIKSAEAHARAESEGPEPPQKIFGASVRQAERRKAQRSAAPPSASPGTVEGASACPSRGPVQPPSVGRPSRRQSPKASVTVEQPPALLIVAEPEIQSNEPMRCDDNTKPLKQQVHSPLEEAEVKLTQAFEVEAILNPEVEAIMKKYLSDSC